MSRNNRSNAHSLLTCTLLFCCALLCILSLSPKVASAADPTITQVKLVDRRTGIDLPIADFTFSQPSPLLNWTTEAEYYLSVTFTKDAGSAAWIKFDIPYGMKYINRPKGTDGTMDVGSVKHELLDSIFSYDPLPTRYGIANANGSVTYAIKESVTGGTLELSLTPDMSFFGRTADLVLGTANPAMNKPVISTSVGNIDNQIPTSVKTLNSIRETAQSSTSMVMNNYPNKSDDHLVGLNGSFTYSFYLMATNPHEREWAYQAYSITFSLPQYAQVEGINISNTFTTESSSQFILQGIPTTTAGRTTYTYRYTQAQNQEKITYGHGFSIKVKFPQASFPVGTRTTFQIINSSLTIPDTGTIVTTTNYSQNIEIVSSAANVSIVPAITSLFRWRNVPSYNGLGNEFLSSVSLKNTGFSSSVPMTLTFEYDKTKVAYVRSIRVPRIGGKDITSISYTVIDGSNVTRTGTYILLPHNERPSFYVITTADLGYNSFASITRIVVDIGPIVAGYDSGSTSMGPYDARTNCTSAYGVFRINSTAAIRSEYSLTETGKSTVLLNTASVLTPDITSPLLFLVSSATRSSPDVMGGESASFTLRLYPYPIVRDQSYSNSSIFSGFKFYVVLPTSVILDDLELTCDEASVPFTITKLQNSLVSAENKTIHLITIDSNNFHLGSFPENEILMVNAILKVAKHSGALTMRPSEIFYFGAAANATGKTNTGGCYSAPDKYLLNGGLDISTGPSNTSITVTPLREVIVSHSTKTASSDGEIDYSDWIDFDPNNTLATRGVVNATSIVKYKASVYNNTGSSVSALDIYIPLPKRDLDLGSFFMDQPSQFSLLDTGMYPGNSVSKYIVDYLHTTNTFTSFPNVAQFTDATRETANMVHIALRPGQSMLADEAADFQFWLRPQDSAADEHGKENIIRARSRYTTAGGNTYIPTTNSLVAFEYASGVIEGMVYYDVNRNSEFDPGIDSPAEGVTVLAFEDEHYERRASTDILGHYRFEALRNDIPERPSTLTLSFENPDHSAFHFSPTRLDGNNPSRPIPEDETHMRGSVYSIRLSDDTPARFSAGLIRPNEITLLTDHEDGTVQPHRVSLFLGQTLSEVGTTPLVTLPFGRYHTDRWRCVRNEDDLKLSVTSMFGTMRSKASTEKTVSFSGITAHQNAEYVSTQQLLNIPTQYDTTYYAQDTEYSWHFTNTLTNTFSISPPPSEGGSM